MPTSPSTRRLSEVARHLVYPAGIVTTSWPRIEARLADMAIRYDSWQSGACRLILGRDENDRYAATVGGVTMSLPRQVGKTFTIGSLLVALCIEYPGLRVVWTSHHLRTTTNTFRAMQGMVRRKRIFPHLAPNGIRTANGEQEIRFTNGSIIMFGAREHGFGVGIDAIDVMVCDEAQRLASRALADMVPTTNQARHVHGALLIFIGTPPRPTDAGDEFAARRSKALDGEMRNGIYIEMSADAEAALDDVEQWMKANPSYPHRTPHESMLRLRENLTDDDDWRREAMGIWDNEDAHHPIDLAQWARLMAPSLAPPDAANLVIDVSPNRRTATLGLAADGPDGKTLVLEETAGGTAWVVPKIVELRSRRTIVEVALHPGSQAGALIPDLVAAGIEFHSLTTQEMGQACSAFQEAVAHGRIAHVGQPELDAAVANARTRYVGEAELWDRRDRTIAISPLVATSAAALRWGKRDRNPRTPLATFI